MKAYNSVPDLHELRDDINDLIAELWTARKSTIADHLYVLLYGVSWKTYSELFKELIKPLKKSLKCRKKLRNDSIDKVKEMIAFIEADLAAK